MTRAIADMNPDSGPSNSLSPGEPPLITVAILNWNRRDDLMLAMESVRRQSYPHIDMLVVDNASSDGSVEAARRRFPEARVYALERNFGCPGGRNRTIPLARGEYIFYCDNDGVLQRDAVARAYRSICTDERIAVVSGRVVPCADLASVDTAADVGHPGEPCFSPTFQGGVSLHRKSVYARVGVYPEDFRYSGEEMNLSFRLLREGLLVLEDPAVILYHKRAATARDKFAELIHRQVTPLANVLEFWPWELALLFVLRSWVLDPWRAFRAGVLGRWIRRWPGAWLTAARSGLRRRKPLPRRIMQVAWRLRSMQERDPDQVFRTAGPYWRDVRHALRRRPSRPVVPN